MPLVPDENSSTVIYTRMTPIFDLFSKQPTIAQCARMVYIYKSPEISKDMDDQQRNPRKLSHAPLRHFVEMCPKYHTYMHDPQK